MLTIEQALQLPSFAGARVVAGAGGLHHAITWVHNVGVPDAAQWLNGGELVLTTALNIPESPEGRCEYLEKLNRRGVSGLVITVGQMLKAIPDYMRSLADAQAFPLIEVPVEARYVDMAREANERIVQQNMSMVTRALDIQRTLTQLVLDGGGISQLAETLAELVNRSISIETANFEALASVNIAPVDEARRYTQQYGRTDPRLVAALEKSILPEIRRTLRPVFIPRMANVGLEMERILAPIVVHGTIYGYMWLIADDRPLADLDRMAIESGATIAALMMLYQESVQAAEASLKGNLLTRLIQGEMTGRNILTDQSLRYGVDLRQPFRMLLIDSSGSAVPAISALERRISRVLETEEHHALTGQFAGQVLILVQAFNDISHLAQHLNEQTQDDYKIRIGISAETSGARLVKDAYMQCREVLHITRRLAQPQPIVWFDQLGYLHALYKAGPEALANNLHRAALDALMDEQGADLFHTLETYLDAGGSAVRTAQQLNIHRSTLNYRMQRISEITGADLSDPVARVNLQMALKLYRLFGDR